MLYGMRVKGNLILMYLFLSVDLRYETFIGKDCARAHTHKIWLLFDMY